MSDRILSADTVAVWRRSIGKSGFDVADSHEALRGRLDEAVRLLRTAPFMLSSEQGQAWLRKRDSFFARLDGEHGA